MSSVRSMPYVPRTPSVPKRRPTSGLSASSTEVPCGLSSDHTCGVPSRERSLPTWPSAVQLPRFVRLRILRCVRVLGTVVHLKLLPHRAPEPVVREHALHGPLDGHRRPLFEPPVVPHSRQPARVTGV